MKFSKFAKPQQTQTPMLDYIQQGISNGLTEDYTQIAKKKRLKYLVLRTPELAGMLWDIAEDIVGFMDFVSISGNGRNREISTKRWARNVSFRDNLLSEVFDTLATGEGFMYLGAQQTEIAEQIQRIKNQTLKDKIYDEAVLQPGFKPISSTTITIRHDDYNLRGYTQIVNGRNIHYMPKEIIHLYFKRMAGRVEGYTPVMTIPIQLELLWLLWTNQMDLQAKGNMPDMVVVAEEIRSNTQALKEVESKLRKYNMPGQSKHGTTVLYGGKYTFQQMERDTSLQFDEVGKAITSVMASIFRYPSHRLAWMPKEKSSSKDAQGNADRDYWDMISKYQDKICDIFNTQLFEPYMGVELVFDKSYKHDSVVENTAMRSRIDNINLINNMLRQEGKQISTEQVLRFVSGKHVDISKQELEEYEMPDVYENMPQMGTPEKQKDKQLSQEKKLEQSAQEKNTGGVNRQ